MGNFKIINPRQNNIKVWISTDRPLEYLLQFELNPNNSDDLHMLWNLFQLDKNSIIDVNENRYRVVECNKSNTYIFIYVH